MPDPSDSTHLTPDLCVIGGGSGGLSVAAGASQMGASVVLVERGAMGGDCLNYGCVPSKSILASGHAAQAQRSSKAFGVAPQTPEIDFMSVRAHVRDVIASIAPMDSVERFEGLGVTVIQASARFTGPMEIEAGTHKITPRRVIIATGSSPAMPPIPGLQDGPALTNEVIFDLDVLPDHLIVLGGGPIGCEMAQAFRQLGSTVTLIEAASILNRDDPEAVDVVRRALETDGVTLLEGMAAQSISWSDGAPSVRIGPMAGGDGAESREITGSHLLVAVGRTPNVGSLNLEAAGVAYAKAGITVDARLRTSNKKVFAIGDVAGGLQFTHVAGYHAGIIIKNALFRIPAKADHSTVPKVTYTHPESASVGLTEAEAQKAGVDYQVLRWSAAENDRAKAERAEEGLIKVLVTPKGRILGCTIAAKNAGELILPWVLALQEKLKISSMATLIAPYPTFSELSKRVAGSWYTPKLFSDKTRKIVRFLARFG